MIRRPPRSTPKPSSAASDVYKRQIHLHVTFSHIERSHGKVSQTARQNTSTAANNVVIIRVRVLVRPTRVPLGSRCGENPRLQHEVDTKQENTETRKSRSEKRPRQRAEIWDVHLSFLKGSDRFQWFRGDPFLDFALINARNGQMRSESGPWTFEIRISEHPRSPSDPHQNILSVY